MIRFFVVVLFGSLLLITNILREENRALKEKNRFLANKVEDQIEELRKNDYLNQIQVENALVEGCYKTIEILCNNYQNKKQAVCKNTMNFACTEL